MTVTIRPLTSADRAVWETLYEGYATFYDVPQTPDMRDRVFDWLMDPGHEVRGFVATDKDGKIIGLTHFRPFASPLRAGVNCFLDDLFVGPNARGSGAADALIGAVVAEAKAKGWGVVRWITHDTNYRARRVYDRLATKTPWVTYDIKVE